MTVTANKKLCNQVQSILKQAYIDHSEDDLDDIALNLITNELQSVYNSHTRKNRGDLLVPENGNSWKRIKLFAAAAGSEHYEVEYKWPTDPFSGTKKYPPVMRAKTCFDRLGADDGSYVSPLKKSHLPYSINERAIPYYFVESSVTSEPSYHLYEVTRDFSRVTLLSEIRRHKRSFKSEKTYEYIVRNIENRTDNWLVYGDTAEVPAFGKQGTGGGKQYKLPISVYYLRKLGLIREIPGKRVMKI